MCLARLAASHICKTPSNLIGSPALRTQSAAKRGIQHKDLRYRKKNPLVKIMIPQVNSLSSYFGRKGEGEGIVKAEYYQNSKPSLIRFYIFHDVF